MLRIATWNVNSIGARLDRLTGFLARVAPDVVCLQELKCVDAEFPRAEIAAAGYEAAVYGQKTYNGVAVLTRGAAETLTRGFDDGVDDPAARFVAARYRGVVVCSAYVPNGQEVGGDKYYYKLNWLARLRRHLERSYRPGTPLVLGGDFNVAPADLDVHDPRAWREALLCTARERQALVEATGGELVDLYRRQHPRESGYTWWDYRAQAFPRDHGLRIDHLYATPELATKLKACWVERDERALERPSDHAPVVAELEV